MPNYDREKIRLAASIRHQVLGPIRAKMRESNLRGHEVDTAGAQNFTRLKNADRLEKISDKSDVILEQMENNKISVEEAREALYRN